MMIGFRNLHKQFVVSFSLRLDMLRIANSARPYLRTLAPARCFATDAAQPLPANAESISNTHFKITLRRSALALGEKKQKTLLSLGITRRNQTVYLPHSPSAAGKILLLKELVEVENVPASAVRTQEEQRKERKPPRGYVIKGNKLRESPWDV
jgi:large subunit ribosomal protein L30